MTRGFTVYNDWKPSKRISELIYFIASANQKEDFTFKLHIIGYNGKIPRHAPDGMQELIETSNLFNLIPEFVRFDKNIENILWESDMYITFTNRDPCPNVVIEAMSYGLPVVGFKSGGLQDIVGNAGILLDENDTSDFFASYRYDNDFPKIDKNKVLEAVLNVKKSKEKYQDKVKIRFDEELNIEVVLNNYVNTILSIL